MFEEHFDPDVEHPTLADGWAADDLRLLDEIANLGLELAECITAEMRIHAAACERGEVAPLPPAEAGKIITAFTRVARCVRLTLALKAYACGGEAAGSQTKAMVIRFDPGHTSSAADGQDTLDPLRDQTQRDRAERQDQEQARERESEVFVFRSPNHALGQICKGLGLPVNFDDDIDTTERFWPSTPPCDDDGARDSSKDPLFEFDAGLGPDALRARLMARWMTRPPDKRPADTKPRGPP